VLGRAAHGAQLLMSPGVAARRDDVETMMRRGCFMRARLPMWIVHDSRCGMFNVILQSRSADHTRDCHHSCGLGGIPGRIRGLLWDRGVGFGQLVPALWHIQAVTQLPFVI
jgi:hypothetical protein